MGTKIIEVSEPQIHSEAISTPVYNSSQVVQQKNIYLTTVMINIIIYSLYLHIILFCHIDIPIYIHIISNLNTAIMQPAVSG
jgi:hypothetical protein